MPRVFDQCRDEVGAMHRVGAKVCACTSRGGERGGQTKPKQERGQLSRCRPSIQGMQHALEASDVEGTIVLEEAQVDELVVDREPVDARIRVPLGGRRGAEAVEDLGSGCW